MMRTAGLSGSFVLSLSACALGFFGCDGGAQTGTGSNSNWLVACDVPADCGAASCLCGLCTRTCVTDDDCDGPVDASCTAADESAAMTQCGAPGDGASLCMGTCEPGSCEAGQTCVDGRCASAPIPENAFCEAARAPADEIETKEEEVLALLQGMRGSGPAPCGDATVGTLPKLRLDGRLVCSARILAGDLDETGALTLVDSQGRSSLERLGLAGYEATLWGEAFGYGADAQASFQAMLEATVSCELLFDPQFTDVGVGCAAGTCVVSLGAEAPPAP